MRACGALIKDNKRPRKGPFLSWGSQSIKTRDSFLRRARGERVSLSALAD
jgi:hypothetical protein